MLLSALARLPFGRWMRTLPSGSPKVFSIFFVAVAIVASLRMLNLRFAGYSRFLVFAGMVRAKACK